MCGNVETNVYQNSKLYNMANRDKKNYFILK